MSEANECQAAPTGRSRLLPEAVEFTATFGAVTYRRVTRIPMTHAVLKTTATGTNVSFHQSHEEALLRAGKRGKVTTAAATERDLEQGLREWATRDSPSCPFHPDRAQVRNGMCEPCAEMADDAR